jgi:hypothetical protein
VSLVFPQQFATQVRQSSWRRFFGGRRRHGSNFGYSPSQPLITDRDVSTEEAGEGVGGATQTNGHHYGTLGELNGDGPRSPASSLHQEGNDWQDE